MNATKHKYHGVEYWPAGKDRWQYTDNGNTMSCKHGEIVAVDERAVRDVIKDSAIGRVTTNKTEWMQR